MSIFLPQSRADQVAHVLHNAHNRDVHQFRHLAGFFYNHRNQVLRGGDNDDAVYRQRLKDGQRNIAGSRRHVDEHIVHSAPDNIAPELFDGAGDDRASPDDRVVGVLQQEVDRHDLGALGGQARINAQLGALRAAGDAEDLRDGRGR